MDDGYLNDEELNQLEQNGIITKYDKIIFVSDVKGLQEISANVNNGMDYQDKKIYVVNDIDCGAQFNMETGELISGENFEPIGDSNSKIEDEDKTGSVIHEFNGIFDGCNYTIKNLYIKDNETTDFCTGLFGYVGEEGTVQNVIISNSYIWGYFETGSIVGRNKGVISNCINESTVIGDHYLSGGIAGRNCNLIDNCENKGDVYRRYSNWRNCSQL